MKSGYLSILKVLSINIIISINLIRQLFATAAMKNCDC